MSALAWLLVAAPSVASRAQGAGEVARREVAVTFDDLPGVAMPRGRAVQGLPEARRPPARPQVSAHCTR